MSMEYASIEREIIVDATPQVVFDVGEQARAPAGVVA